MDCTCTLCACYRVKEDDEKKCLLCVRVFCDFSHKFHRSATNFQFQAGPSGLRSLVHGLSVEKAKKCFCKHSPKLRKEKLLLCMCVQKNAIRVTKTIVYFCPFSHEFPPIFTSTALVGDTLSDFQTFSTDF